MTKDELPDIDPSMLEAVTGGVTSSSSDSDQQVMAMLQDLMSSIGELAKGQQNNGSSQFMQMLPMLMMMRGQQGGAPPPPPIQYAPPPGDWTRVA